MEKSGFGLIASRWAGARLGGLSFRLAGSFEQAEEDNPRYEQAKAEDGKQVIEHNQFRRLVLARTRARRVRRTPTHRMSMLGTQRPT